MKVNQAATARSIAADTKRAKHAPFPCGQPKARKGEVLRMIRYREPEDSHAAMERAREMPWWSRVVEQMPMRGARMWWVWRVRL